MDLNANGVKVSTGSLETFLTNGVTFGIPEDMPTGDIITERSYFDIHPSYELASEERYLQNAAYLLLVEDTVRGLKVGAPVEYRGLVIGKVLAINIELSSHKGLLENSYDIPILIGIQPGRVGRTDDEEGLNFVYQQIDQWVEQGLMVTLKIGNILTGSLFVDLQHYDNEPVAKNLQIDNLKVIPFRAGEFSQITDKVSSILDTLNDLKLQTLSNNANDMLLQVSESATSLQSASENVDKLLNSVEQQKMTQNINNTLKNLDLLLQTYSKDSRTNQEINRTMKDLQRTMKDLQPLLLQLNNTPNSLIFTGSRPSDVIPRAKQSTSKGTN
ncbi:MlaD family protein [Paraglaciecola aquimarina]|uniref:MlaD family protein n=1 Tax=Paraglaciecola aquimarina TaxID=1235557 RepID=A0ABU3SXJ7_9ALTE|nr:MlaD family protein [Paraglaciecola aquimarina]MDU0354731.1 MlaD family protein [Paraglaciecola aquimarina]